MAKQQSYTLLIVLAFLAGLFGSYVSDQFTTPPSAEPDSNTQTEITREVIAENAVIEVADRLHDSVVSIVGTKDVEYVMRDPRSFFFNDPRFDDFFGIPRSETREPEVRREKKQVGAGTGFVISEDGLILTNKHVVSDSEAEYTVFFADESEFIAEVITRDPTNDLAILQIKNEDGEKFKAVEFVPDQTNVKVGQLVVAIGNALGQFDNTITLGVISANGRTITAGDGRGSTERLSELLQTDAAINPGNSGGPLVALSGKVLGVNTAVAGGAQGIGFAIPMDQPTIRRILDQIEKFGKIVKPFLGVRYQLITPELNKEMLLGSDYGAWLHGEDDLPAVVADTPAAEAGLKGGDIIIEVDGKKVDTDNTLADQLNKLSPEDIIELTILRDGQEEKLKVTLGEWEEG
ncbi:MAG: trypsin-like peptidase domain-containing protein [Patescibacteria group bacterium]